MKKRLSIVVLLLLIVSGCNGGSSSSSDSSTTVTSISYRSEVREDVDQVLLDELHGAFLFFYETANDDENSPAYGLIPDRFHTHLDKPGTVSSIASVGFGLSMIPVGVEYEWISYEEASNRVLKTLITLENLERVHGFYYHFLSMSTGRRVWNSEVSVIDTAILMNGVLTAGKYFGGEIEQKANKLYEEVEWNWYFDDTTYRFYMSYKPEEGFSGSWSGYAEQLMMFVLSAGSPTYSLDKSPYLNMKYSSILSSKTDAYDPFYLTWTGSLFTYQFSHAWIDFRNIEDEKGVNWFTNSVNATKAAIEFSKLYSNRYKSMHENSWGLSASDGPNGYIGPYGIAPNSGSANVVDGTVPPYGAIGSIVFTPEESIKAIKYYRTYDKLWSKYGFKDAYNLGTVDGYEDESIKGKIPEGGWFATDIIGIDKGISALMIENYISSFIWNIYMDIDYVKNGLEVLGFTPISEGDK